MAREDIRSQAQDVYGKPGISYDSGDRDYPKIVVHRTGKAGETPKEYFTPHDKFQQALLTVCESSPGDGHNTNVVEVYETLPGPWLPSRDFDPALGPVQVRRRIVRNTGQTATISGATTITYEARDGSAIVSIETERTFTFSGNAVVSRSFDEFGGLETETKTIVAASTAPVNTIGDSDATSERVDGRDGATAILESTLRQISIVTSEIDDVDGGIPGSRAVISTYLVFASSSIPEDTNTTTYNRKNFPRDPNLKVEIKTVYDIPADFIETDDNSFSFPRLLYGFVGNEFYGDTVFARAGFSEVVPHTVYHTFSTTRSAPVVDAISEVDCTVLGIHIHGLIDDPFTVTRNVGGVPASVTIPYSSGGISFPTSTPTLSVYLASWVGAEKIVGGDCRIYRAGIYHKRTIKVTMK